MDVQVLWITDSCGHDPAMIVLLNVMTGSGSQLSREVAIPVFAGSVLAVHSIVIGGGHDMTGDVLSSIIIVWTHVEIFPHASVDDHVRWIVYSNSQPPAVVISV